MEIAANLGLKPAEIVQVFKHSRGVAVRGTRTLSTLRNDGKSLPRTGKFRLQLIPLLRNLLYHIPKKTE